MPPRKKAARNETTPARPGTPAGGSGDGAAPAVAPLAPPTPESFDDLAHRVARIEPRRGSVVQPPPAWQPDEVTLGFAMVSDASGELHELPEPALLATILIAAESDRKALVHRFAGGFGEEIDAIANLFWPFLVIHEHPGAPAAIFDGTGVWRRTFRHTLLPSADGIRPLFDRSLAPARYLDQMRTLTPYFSRDPGAEVLSVEGFLPLDPPLLFDVLSQSRFRTDPQSAHAGFLPARHPVEWYDDVVREMRRWLDRFESDLRVLQETRTQIEAIVKETRARLEAEFQAKREQAHAAVEAGTARANEEVERLARSHHAEIQRYLAVIRKSQGTVAHHEASIVTADALSFRANQRRVDPSPHEARGKQSRLEIRDANRQIAESRRMIERIHDQQRSDQERAIAQVMEVERTHARGLSDFELFHDEYVAAGLDLLQAIDGQIAARTSQKNLLEGYFLPLPPLASVRVVWFPLWTATLRGSRGVRQLVFPPMQVRKELGLGGAIKRLFGGIVLPLEPRTEQFDKLLRPTMEDAFARDPWLASATQELTRAADVLVDPDLLDRLRDGLANLRHEGWITSKQEEEFFQAYVERSRRRVGGGPSAHGAAPPGARAEPFPKVPPVPPPTTPRPPAGPA